MNLWLWYAPGTNAQITAACQIAQVTLDERGVDALTAHQASIDAAELPKDYVIEETPQASAVAAWYAAEFAALQALFEATGQWPELGALIYVKDE